MSPRSWVRFTRSTGTGSGHSKCERAECRNVHMRLRSASAFSWSGISIRNEDDIPGILAGLSADHITLAPNEPLLADEQRYRAWHQSRIDSFTFSITFSSEDIRLEGDLAVERWSSALKLTPRAGGTDIEDQSKGLWVWQRQADGTWKLLWSIWNSDNAIVPNQ